MATYEVFSKVKDTESPIHVIVRENNDTYLFYNKEDANLIVSMYPDKFYIKEKEGGDDVNDAVY